MTSAVAAAVEQQSRTREPASREHDAGPRPFAAHSGLLTLQEVAGNRAVARLLTGGELLDSTTRAEMEAAFGYDFGGVRVHADTAAHASALDQEARAFTVGEDIVFGEGGYAPHTSEGRRLLAHELAHVVQQTRARGNPTSPSGAEGEADAAASAVGAGGHAQIASAASGVQRQELTDEDKRRLASQGRCPSGNCHEPVRSTPTFGPIPTFGGAGRSGTFGGFGEPDTEALRKWIDAQQQQQQQPPPKPQTAATTDPDQPPKPLPAMKPPTNYKAPPGIANLPRQRKTIHVAELFVPETKFGTPFGAVGTRMFSQADVVAQYNVQITEPDPTAGYNFDTYLWNISTGQRIPAQYLGGTRFRVFMGTPECPGCHFGHGLEVDLHGESFVTVMAQGVMTAMTVSDLASMAGSITSRPPFIPGARVTTLTEADEAALSAMRARTPQDEFDDFTKWLQEEGSTGATSGEPVTMQPHGAARDARQLLDVTGDEAQSMHGLPRSIGRHLPGYDPDAALTTLGEKAMHSELDQPWKDAFQGMRRQGRTTASAQEIYDAVAGSIDGSTQLSSGVKHTLKLRLHDEMFLEYGLQPGQQMTLPYRNIKPRP